MLGSVVANRQPGRPAAQDILISVITIVMIILRHSNGIQQRKLLHTLRDIFFPSFPELMNGRNSN
jgi:hypothetical protein